MSVLGRIIIREIVERGRSPVPGSIRPKALCGPNGEPLESFTVYVPKFLIGDRILPATEIAPLPLHDMVEEDDARMDPVSGVE